MNSCMFVKFVSLPDAKIQNPVFCKTISHLVSYLTRFVGLYIVEGHFLSSGRLDRPVKTRRVAAHVQTFRNRKMKTPFRICVYPYYYPSKFPQLAQILPVRGNSCTTFREAVSRVGESISWRAREAHLCVLFQCSIFLSVFIRVHPWWNFPVFVFRDHVPRSGSQLGASISWGLGSQFRGSSLLSPVKFSFDRGSAAPRSIRGYPVCKPLNHNTHRTW